MNDEYDDDEHEKRINFHLSLLGTHARQFFSFVLGDICASPECEVVQYFEGEVVNRDSLNHQEVDYYEILVDGKVIFFHKRLYLMGLIEEEMARVFEMLSLYPKILPLEGNEDEVLQYYLEMSQDENPTTSNLQ